MDKYVDKKLEIKTARARRHYQRKKQYDNPYMDIIAKNNGFQLNLTGFHSRVKNHLLEIISHLKISFPL